MTSVLLASNSTNPGGTYLEHLEDATRSHFHGCDLIAFVPYALADLDGYADVARRRFAGLGLDLVSVHEGGHPRAVLEQSDGVFIGGGNTFRLLDRLVRHDLVEEIRSKVATGAPYMGASAGSNVACPTIMTTNDMPIVEVASFEALGLVDFQINAHYVDRDPDVSHGGETRAQRITEYHEEHRSPVVGLREGSWLTVAHPDTTPADPHPDMTPADPHPDMTPADPHPDMTPADPHPDMTPADPHPDMTPADPHPDMTPADPHPEVTLAGPHPAVLFLPEREPLEVPPGPLPHDFRSMNDT